MRNSLFELPHEKTGQQSAYAHIRNAQSAYAHIRNEHMRNQRRRSASR